MNKELDRQCATALGLEIIHESWPVGVPPDGGTREAALHEDDTSYWWRERGMIYKVRDPEDDWKAELGLWCDPVPLYSSDNVAARLLEDEIEKRGLQERYAEAIDRIVPKTTTPNVWQTYLWDMIRATPEQKARAFLEAVACQSA